VVEEVAEVVEEEDMAAEEKRSSTVRECLPFAAAQ
jgi:hypothetical protein